MHVYLCIICMSDASGSQKRVSDLLEFELQIVRNHTKEVLGIEFRTSRRAASALNHCLSYLFGSPVFYM